MAPPTVDTLDHPPPRGTRAIPVAPLRRAVQRGRLSVEAFTWGTLFSCLALQRFALPAGGDLKISIATPLVLGLAAWALLSGTLVIDRVRMMLYFGLCAVALFSVGAKINLPLGIAPRMSTTSLAYWLAITAFAALRFRVSMSETAFFRIVTLCLIAVAAAGLAQFVLQFVGLSLFSFSGIVPDSLLIEDQYAVATPTSFGFKSNGFFLIEPSVFAQFMGIGVIVEALYFRRPIYFALFFIGLLISVSGTGWMILGSYIIVLAISAGIRGLLGAIALTLACAIAFAALSFILPDVADMMSSRLTEFTLPGTSGYERFVTPYMALQSVLDAAPWTIVTGVGPGGSEQLTVPYFYRLNTPVKVLMEYGAFGLMFYLGLLVVGKRTRRQLMLLPPLLVLLLLTGGYHQFSPILFAVLLIGTVAFVHRDQISV